MLSPTATWPVAIRGLMGKKQGNVPTAVVGDELQKALKEQREQFETAKELASEQD